MTIKKLSINEVMAIKLIGYFALRYDFDRVNEKNLPDVANKKTIYPSV